VSVARSPLPRTNGGAGEYAEPQCLSGWQGPELFEEQRRMHESHRRDAKLVLGEIDTMECQVRMCDESAPDLVEVCSIDIEADDSLDGRCATCESLED
jgi:hypothetical protein